MEKKNNQEQNEEIKKLRQQLVREETVKYLEENREVIVARAEARFRRMVEEARASQLEGDQ